MPKYFLDVRPLPFERIDWSIDDINSEAVTAVFSERQAACFCIRLPGLPASCMGYLINIQRTDHGFDALDISGKKLVSLKDYVEVVSMLRHAAGVRSDDSIREQLLRVRDVSS